MPHGLEVPCYEYHRKTKAISRKERIDRKLILKNEYFLSPFFKSNIYTQKNESEKSQGKNRQEINFKKNEYFLSPFFNQNIYTQKNEMIKKTF